MKTEQTWSIWIDEFNKIISTKQIPKTKELQFKNKDSGIEVINKLASKGFKIG